MEQSIQCDMEITLINTLRQNYTYVRNKFNDFTCKIVRASSIVECINSLIRPNLSLKWSHEKS